RMAGPSITSRLGTAFAAISGASPSIGWPSPSAAARARRVMPVTMRPMPESRRARTPAELHGPPPTGARRHRHAARLPLALAHRARLDREVALDVDVALQVTGDPQVALTGHHSVENVIRAEEGLGSRNRSHRAAPLPTMRLLASRPVAVVEHREHGEAAA